MVLQTINTKVTFATSLNKDINDHLGFLNYEKSDKDNNPMPLPDPVRQYYLMRMNLNLNLNYIGHVGL